MPGPFRSLVDFLHPQIVLCVAGMPGRQWFVTLGSSCYSAFLFITQRQSIPVKSWLGSSLASKYRTLPGLVRSSFPLEDTQVLR